MVAGEASGDLLAGSLLASLRARWPQLVAEGIGGPRMAEHAGQPILPPEELQQAVGETPRPGIPPESPRHPPLTPIAGTGGVGVPAGATPVFSRPPAAGEEAGDVVSLDPSTIKIDAARFQFKSGGDARVHQRARR